jgi:hypothetical protein
MGMRGHILVGALFLSGAIGLLAQAPQAPPSNGQVAAALTNADVIAMVQAGLDEGIILSKIQHSSPAFNTETSGLVELKTANVPPAVVKAMIERADASSPPEPAAPVEAKSAPPVQAPQAKTFDQVERIRIRADSEVLRVVMEEQLRKEGGPAVSSSETDYDATLSFATDCGAQTISMWTGANFCTCEGSMTLESVGTRLYANIDRERSANAAKSSKIMVQRMLEKFVDAWKKARKR